MRIPDAELLAEIETLIEDFRWARPKPEAPEHKTYAALKQIAGDIRARQPVAVLDAVTALQKRLDSAERAVGGPHENYHRVMAGVGEELRGRWPAVLQALNELGAK